MRHFVPSARSPGDSAGGQSPGPAAASPESASNVPVIQLSGVTFQYEQSAIVTNVDLVIYRGDFACLVGPNGGGKTTLLKLMLGVLEPTKGSVRVLGRPPRESRRRLGYMAQASTLDPRFPITVIEVVLMGRLGERQLGFFTRADRAFARECLNDVGLADMADRSFSRLSGGQRQRVLIARALACEPEILLLDEPTSNVDVGVEEQLYSLLQELNRRLTLVIVSHDVGFVSKYPRTAICVNRSVHVHHSRDLTGEVIQNLYGREIRVLSHPTFVPLGRSETR